MKNLIPGRIDTGQEIPAADIRLDVTKRSDKLINYFLVSYFIVGLIFSFFYDTWSVAIGVGGLSLLAYYSVKKALPHSNLYQYVLSVILGIFMAQYIYQMHGLFEMHFFAFIGSAILVTYQNWKLQIPMLVVVIVHHIAFGYLQNIGFDTIYFTQLDYFELQPFIIHFLLAIVIFFICGLWAYQLKKYREAQIDQAMKMGKMQKDAMLVQELAILKESLEKEKYYLDSLMDNMPDSIYFKDRESRFMRVSKYLGDHFGSTAEEIIGKSDFDFMDQAHARAAYEDEQNIQKTKIPKIDYIEKETRKDGVESWVTTTKMPLFNPRGEVVGTFGMSRDITNLKILEAERHSAEMDRAVAQGKSEIASDMMHDIGNAVVGFGSYVTRIRRTMEQSTPDNMQKLVEFFTSHKTAMVGVIGNEKADALVRMLCGIALTQRSNQEEISNSINEQLHIISHIQEILSIQRQYITGHESQERKQVNLGAIINDSMSMVFPLIEKMAIVMSLNVPTNLPLIKGDRTRLMQVMLNVLKNSIEAINNEGTDKSIALNAYIRADLLILEVKDTGSGFDKLIAQRLFTRGFTTKTSGSGMGLYNSKTIVESHDGTIDILSEGPGKGAVAMIAFKLTA